MHALDHLVITRQQAVALGDALGDARTVIPSGYRNNALWNLAHLESTAELLLYKLSGLPLSVTEDDIASFAKGSSPEDWDAPPDWGVIRERLTAQPARIRADHEAGRFETYTEYTTSAGVTLTCFEDALAFNEFHEGLHLGYLLAMRKALA